MTKNVMTLCKLISFCDDPIKMPADFIKHLDDPNFKFKWNNKGPKVAKSKIYMNGTGQSRRTLRPTRQSIHF
jgi:hypothetical protein